MICFSCSVACFQKHKSSGNGKIIWLEFEFLLIGIETCVEKNLQLKSMAEGEQGQYQTQLPIELGDDEESDRLPTQILEQIG